MKYVARISTEPLTRQGQFNKLRPARRAALCLAVAACILSSAAYGFAQKCGKLKPAGDGRDDSARINECLQTKGKAKLKQGTFLLFGPIIFPRESSGAEVSGIELRGKGMDETRLVVQSDCINHWPFVDDQPPGQYQPAIQVVRSPGAVVKELELDLRNLRQDCGYTGNYMLLINRSPATTVTGVRIAGSRFGAAGYTTGGANGGGIRVVNSQGAVVNANTITDLGFAKENEGFSAGSAGILVENSGDTLVQDNKVVRVSFGIAVANGTPQNGYIGDSSGTAVVGNTIVGAANINCANCSQGRAIKLQACGAGDELPLERMTVSNNIATEFGGANGAQGGSGLDLVCGVRYSTFLNNSVIGAGTAEFGLQIRSSFLSPSSTTHHNTFMFNSFASGRGQIGCNDECADVNFTSDGPDQIGVRRNGENRTGTNTADFLRYSTDRGCNEHSHAFFNYLDGQNFVRQGEKLLLAASGVRPSTITRFRFIREDNGVEAASYTTGVANRNCIVNQEYLTISASEFAPGFYNVFADYEDGNSTAAITGDPLGKIRVDPARQR